MNHSCMPQRATLKIEPVRERWNLSAAKTPNWQVTELKTRIMVLPIAKGSVSLAVSMGHSSGTVARIEKCIAKIPAKNMSSLESHTMVPTETDRKSTRLNSSHVAISYAVFCVQKNRRSYEVTWNVIFHRT